MAMIGQLFYSVPTVLVPFFHKVLASILDHHIVYFCQLEKLGPSPILRSIAYDIFGVCGWLIREFGLPRLSPYKRSPDGPDEKTGLMSFGHTPFDSLPFYQKRSFWNLWGYGAWVRRFRGIPLPSAEYYGNGVAIESMGVNQKLPVAQAVVEKKVREKAVELEQAPYGFRPPIAFQYARLVGPVEGPEYGSKINAFADFTPLTPASIERFEKKFERRTLGFSKLDTIDKPEDVVYFNKDEAYGHPNGIKLSPTHTIKATA